MNTPPFETLVEEILEKVRQRKPFGRHATQACTLSCTVGVVVEHDLSQAQSERLCSVVLQRLKTNKLPDISKLAFSREELYAMRN